MDGTAFWQNTDEHTMQLRLQFFLKTLQVAIWCLLATAAVGQKSKPLPAERDAFIREFRTRMTAISDTEAQLITSRVYNAWNSAYFTDTQKDRIIQQTNALIDRGLKFYPDMAGYLNVAIASTQPGSYVRIELIPFIEVVDSCMSLLSQEQLSNFLAFFGRFALQGDFYLNKNYRIRFPQCEGKLYLASMPDPNYAGDPRFQPSITFPAFRITTASDVVLYTPDVGTTIYNTEGTIDFASLKFYGEKGTYTWERAGLDPNQVFCTLDRYVLSLHQRGIEADSVRFNKPNAPGGFILGKLKDPLTNNANLDALQFPEFRSYTAGVELIEFMKYADYIGGYSLRGRHQFGTSTADTAATVFIKHAGKRAVRVQADAIPLDDSTGLNLKRKRVTIELGNGKTIYHPGLDVVYEPEKPLLSLIKNPQDAYYEQLMTSNYHRFNMHFVQTRWNPEEDSLYFSALIDQEHRTAFLESEDYFVRSRYKIYSASFPVNLIDLLYDYILARRRKEVKAYRDKYAPKAEDPAATPEPPAEVDFYSDDFYSMFVESSAEPFTEGEPVPEESEPDTTAEEAGPPPPNFTPFKAPFTLTELLTAFPKWKEMKEGFRQLLIYMDRAGYIYYDRTLEQITPRTQLIRWAQAANNEKDWDVIQLVSQTKDRANAHMSWETGVLRLDGIEGFILSDSQQVTIRPQHQFVRVYENRNLQFGGLIYAGKANFWGKGTAKFEFNYPRFNIYCEKLDSVKFYPERDESFDPRANPTLVKALRRLTIEDVVGSIYINHPANKSGLKRQTQYPIFDCYSIAYVYWSDRSTQAGQYKRDRLFFALDPFALDSLENFDIRGLQFQGEFDCDSIVPTFRDTLRPVSDNTYGVEQYFPDGIPVYRGAGTFTNKLQMDRYGLWGQGSIAYLNTLAQADTFTFHFDSCMAVLKAFNSPETTLNGVYFPEMITEGRLNYTWYPYQERMVIETMDEPITMHNGTVTFTGKVVYTPKGVIGKGVLESGSIALKGDSINLSTLQIQVVEGTFEVSDPDDPEVLVFQVRNADTELNIETKEVQFVTKSPGTALVSFPAQQYESTLPNGSYNQETGDIKLTTTYPEKKFNIFRSTNPGQHGLQFPVGSAVFNRDRQELLLYEVDSILVADAIVYPAMGNARINPDGKLGLMENAQLRADTTNRAHLLDQCQLAIENRLVYKGSGRYPYKTAGVKDQYFEFASLRSLPDTTSYGDGEISSDQEFLISDRIFFRGKVEMYARRKFLGFDGEVKIQSDNSLFADSWFAFKDTLVNPDTVFVPIDNPKNRAGRPLTVGLHYSETRRLYYTNFFQPLRVATDITITEAKGGLTYNREAREFRVGPRRKIEGQAYKGNVVSYDDDLQIITVKGRFNIANHFLEPAEGQQRGIPLLDMAGMWREDLQKRTVNSRMIVRVQMPAVPEAALKELHRQMNRFAFDRPDINYQDELLLESAAEFLDADSSSDGEAKTLKFIQQVEKAVLPEDVKLSREIGGALVLTDVQFAYNDSVKGFWCTTPVGWSGIGPDPLGKVVDARIEYRPGRPVGNSFTNDTLNIYLGVDENTWVFFQLAGNTVSTISTEGSYNGQIQQAVDKQKEPEGNHVQVLAILEQDEVTRFLRRFSQYLYIER